MKSQPTEQENEDRSSNDSKRLNGRSNANGPNPTVTARPAVSISERVLWQDPEGLCHYTPIRDVPLKPGVYSGSIDHPALQPELYEVRASRKRRADAPLAEIKMREGMSIKTTHAHGLLTMGKDGTLRKIRPGEVAEGETLVPRAQPNVPFGTGPSSVSMNTPSGNGRQLEINLDRDAGFLYGIYIAEGSAGSKGYKHLQIAATEKEIRKRTVDVLECWGLKTRSYQRTISTTCAALGRTLAETCGTGAENKRIPDLLWTAPRAFRDGFISGYLSGDGTVNGGEVSATTVSKELADGLVFLFASMGIRASYRMYEKGRYQDQYLIKIYQEGVDRLPALALTRKQKRMEKIQNSETKFSRNRVPIPESLKTEVVRALRENDVAHSVYSKGYATRQCLNKVYGELPTRMQEIVDAPLWWEVVESVEETHTESCVCNLDTENRLGFMVSGGLLACSSHG